MWEKGRCPLPSESRKVGCRAEPQEIQKAPTAEELALLQRARNPLEARWKAPRANVVRPALRGATCPPSPRSSWQWLQMVRIALRNPDPPRTMTRGCRVTVASHAGFGQTGQALRCRSRRNVEVRRRTAGRNDWAHAWNVAMPEIGVRSGDSPRVTALRVSTESTSGIRRLRTSSVLSVR